MKTYQLPGGLAGPPSVCSAAPDRLDVFVAGAGGTVWRWSQNGGPLLAPVPLPANGTIPAEGICAVASGPGRVEVFAVDAGTRIPVWWRGNGTTWTTGPALIPGATIPAVRAVTVLTPSSMRLPDHPQRDVDRRGRRSSRSRRAGAGWTHPTAAARPDHAAE